MKIDVTREQRDALAGFVPNRRGHVVDMAAAIVRAWDEAETAITMTATIGRPFDVEDVAEASLKAGEP